MRRIKLEPIKGGWAIRLRCGAGQHHRFRIHLASEPAAQERAQRMAELARSMVAAGRADEAPVIVRKAGAQTTDAGLLQVEAFVRELCGSGGKPDTSVTFQQLAERWTSGELARVYPDQIRVKRSVENDRVRLGRLFKTIGSIPLAEFSLADAKRAMAAIPEGRRPGTRRHYGQVIARLLKMAVYPCEIIERFPLPPGFLPKLGQRPALSFLYPAEDAQLMACTDVPLETRLLYGFLAREGLRLGEALELRWRHLDLLRGTVRLERTKTGESRAWALNPGVVAALTALRERQAKAKAVADQQAPSPAPGEESKLDDSFVFPGVDPKLAKAFRAHLEVAQVKRAELFERNEHRRPIRVHDLRATFITLALASERSETWVQDRTGHTSSAMLNLYRRQARHAAELSLGQLERLNLAIPELRPAVDSTPQGVQGVCSEPEAPDPSPETEQHDLSGGPCRGRTGMPLRARDFKSPASAIPPRGHSGCSRAIQAG